ncbi:MutS protein msh5 [Steccherinum ochraceum]|uniref:MutS protein msh5 n=1 Tax=Steccherinum ochraceum TaxID=92696 RepID=A0A4R0RG70_9APHY|nr:MutS protein msh5 [Steccherinum ochraceum]
MPSIDSRVHARKRKGGTEDGNEGTAELSDSENSSRKRVRWDGEVVQFQEETTEEDDEDSSVRDEKVCMAVSCQFGRVGCAYYDPVTCKLLVLEDSQESPHYDLTTMLLEQVDPDVILTTSKAEDNFLEILRNHMDTTGGQFTMRPYKDFIPTRGRDRALSLSLLSELSTDTAPDDDHSSDSGSRSAYDFMRRRKDVNEDPDSQRWNAAIRLANYASVETSPLCMGSVGALLDHLARIRAVGELDDEGIGGLEIRDIECLALNQVMQINADALFSLQIFDVENHASVHSDKTKEGLSIYSIFNSTKTSLGRSMMRQWLLRPSLSLSVINGRHDVVACLNRPDNIITANSLHDQLHGIRNVPRTVEAMKSGKAKVSDWQAIMKFSYVSVLLRDTLAELTHTSGVGFLRKLNDILDDSRYKEIGTAVHSIVDWDESAQAGRVCVRPHIDEELDEMKHLYNGIDEVLVHIADDISADIDPAYAVGLNVVYFPQLAYLICVPILDKWREEGAVEERYGWELQFTTQENAYFKSKEMRDMDNYIGDVHSSIVDKEIEIIQELQEKILTYKDIIGQTCDICAELDCLLAFAAASRIHNFIRPEMSEDTVTHIVQGRHPLHELLVDSFVPNDIDVAGGGCAGSRRPLNEEDESELDSEEELNSVVVCTGANACGKSVYLKQVAVIHYLAQVGCFVPAERATLGIVDKIFTRIQTRESVSKIQSAFMIDLNQVSLALRNCTSRSLILLDEFGKGTKSAGWSSSLVYWLVLLLLICVIKHFVNRGANCPRVLVATHFHDVFRNEILDVEQLPVTFVHMQVLLKSSKGELIAASDSQTGMLAHDESQETGINEDQSEVQVSPKERLTYLFRVQKGLWLHSHAALCAEIFGIPRQVARRAAYVSRLLSQHEIGQLLDEEMDDQERQELSEAEEVCRRFLAWDIAGGAGSEESVKAKLAEVLGKASDAGAGS